MSEKLKKMQKKTLLSFQEKQNVKSLNLFSFEHCFVVHCLAIKTFCQIYILYFFAFFQEKDKLFKKRQGTILQTTEI